MLAASGMKIRADTSSVKSDEATEIKKVLAYFAARG